MLEIFGATELILVALTTGTFMISQYFSKPKRSNIPGPPALPLLGNIFQLSDKPHLKLAKWAKEYGKMYKLQLGNNFCVVVNDAKLLKEMLSDSVFSARPKIPLFDMFSGGQHGIISTNGKTWEEQRRWSIRKLRDYGFGKTTMEGIIMEEVNEVIEFLVKHGESPIEIKDRFSIAVLNVIWTILNGDRLSQEDPKMREVLASFQGIGPIIAKSGLQFAPWLKYIFQDSYETVKQSANKVMKYATDAVALHFNTYKKGENRNFIDEYIEEIENTTDPNSSFFQEKGRKNLEGTVSDLIQAGSETTSHTINWTLCYLTYYNDVQVKIREELDSVIGRRPASLSDRPKLDNISLPMFMPYTEAVILETLRYSSLVASGIQHCAMTEKMVGGYLVPKDAWILINMYYVHHNPDIWGDPENFRPERFLSPDGKRVIKHKALIPFQLGRRQCLGESLAKDTLFLFISSIFQNFTIDKVEKCKPEPENGIFLIPKPYNFSFKFRG